MDNDEILQMRIERTTNGLLIEAKSPQLEEFFQSLSGNETATIYFAGDENRLEVYDIGDSQGARDVGLIGRPGRHFISADAQPNLNFLRTVGIADGIEVEVNELASIEELKRVVSAIRKGVHKIYQEYMEPAELELSIKKANSS